MDQWSDVFPAEDIPGERPSDLASICSDCGVWVKSLQLAFHLQVILTILQPYQIWVLTCLYLALTEQLWKSLGIVACINQRNQQTLHQAAPSNPALQVETSDSSCSESFAPKLKASAILKMKQFQKPNPSEIWCSGSMPSNHLLALAAHNVSKAKWKWAPWKLRMSIAKEEEIQTNSSSKVPKMRASNSMPFSWMTHPLSMWQVVI